MPSGSTSAGPVGERRAQRGHVLRTEAEGREDRVAPAVEAPGGVGEVTVIEAGIQPAGEADRVVDAVEPQRRGRVDVIARLGPPRFSELSSQRPSTGRSTALFQPAVLLTRIYLHPRQRHRRWRRSSADGWTACAADVRRRCGATNGREIRAGGTYKAICQARP